MPTHEQPATARCGSCEELRAQLDALKSELLYEQLEALRRASEPTRKRLERIEEAARAMLREANDLVEQCHKPGTSCTPPSRFEWAVYDLRAALAAEEGA